MTESSTSPSADTSVPDRGVLRTRLNKPWLIRVIGLLIGVSALAGWFALDAWVIYPKRGEEAIKFGEYAYLQVAQGAGLLDRQVDIPDPQAERERLNEQRSAPGGLANDVEVNRLEWLTRLSRLHDLGAIAERNEAALRVFAGEAGEVPDGPLTVFRDYRARLAELHSELGQVQQAPKPLSTYDMPSQYAGLIVSVTGVVLLLIFFFRVRSQVYTFEPATRRLTLPDGFSFTPDQIETVDKRKWDKFIVFLTLQGESEERRIDLFRHAPLEEWILEMEKHHPNYDPDADEDEDEMDEGGDADGSDEQGSLRTE